jgi:tetratricopeptide (TPR) repeat protein
MIGVFLFLSQLQFNVKPVQLSIAFVCVSSTFAFIAFKRSDVYKDQVSFIEAAIEASPANSFFYQKKGEIFAAKDDYVTAVSCFDKAIGINPESDHAYFNRAKALMALGKKDRSLADYTAALNMATSRSKPAMLMQRCIAYNLFEEAELAMEDLEALKECCAELVEPAFEKEIVLKSKIEAWRKKISDSPKDASLYLMRAFFFIESHMAKEALRDFEMASKLEPGNSDYKECLRRATIDFGPEVENE